MDVAEWMRANRIALPGELAERIEAVKTIGAYRRSLWASTRDFYNQKLDAGEYLDKVIASIETQMRKAWYEGMRNVGLDPTKDMLPEFETQLQSIVNSEFDHVLQLAQDVEAARVAGNPVEPFRTRVDMWVNRYSDVVNQSMLEAKPEQRYRWIYGDTQHCGTCAMLHGTVATGTMWRASGFHPQQPPNAQLECGGWRCQCRFEATDAPITEGGIPQ